MAHRTDEFIQFLAQRNVMDGILYEPRIKCQLFDFSNATQVRPLASDDATFINGEQYPVRVTHIVAAIRDQGPNPYVVAASSDPRLVQQIGLRVRAHDTFYMNDEFVRLPLWATQPTAGPDPVSRALSSWTFGFGKHRSGVFMGSKDNFQVHVALEYPVDADEEEGLGVWVTFHGVGAESRRPKQLTGFRTFTAADGVAPRAIAPQSFLNDGTEPLEITEITVHCQAPDGTAGTDPSGNIRRLRMKVQQSGNGTNQRWTNTPNIASPIPGIVNLDDCVPASLWGLTTGRSVVHELPKNSDEYPGWLWYPNEGMTLEVQPAPDLQTAVYVALVGHIVVM